MNAKEIATALARAKTVDELTKLAAACAPRRQQIDARMVAIGQIRQPGGSPFDPEIDSDRARACLDSPEKIIELDREVELLLAEKEQLDFIEAACVRKSREVEHETARREIPIAAKQLPKAIQKARESLLALNAEIARVTAVVDCLGKYGDLPGYEFPLNDSELLELLKFREEVWRVASVRVLYPLETHPRSFRLFYRPTGHDSFGPRRRDDDRFAREWPDNVEADKVEAA
jgi:hypothetical protein